MNATHLGSALAMLIGAALAAGCALPPKKAQQAPALDAERVGLAGPAIEPAAPNWWQSFHDPQLDRLISAALEHSPTLEQARTRVADAAAQSLIARSRLLPGANLDASTFYQRAPANYVLPPPLGGHTFWLGQSGLSLSWDLDLSGRQAALVQRGEALAGSSRLDQQNARLMLSAAVAQAYIELYRETALATIAERSAEQRQNIVDITRRRVAAGVDTQLELRQAEGQLPQAHVASEQARGAADLAVHELASLSGQGAESYASITSPQLDIDAALPLPTVLPVNLLVRRPDVLAARLNVAAADAQRLADRAAFYPDVNLRALAGIGSFGLSNLFQWDARGAAGGPSLSLPLFDGGRLRAQYQRSAAQLDGAVAQYNDTVLRAVQQAADQLTRIDALARERVEQERTLTANEAAYRLAEERYRAGLASYLAVLNAETQVLVARQTMVAMIADQAIARIELLLALGGSFDPRSDAQDLRISPALTKDFP